MKKKRLLGGRAYSFNDLQTNEPIDNGQHFFMGCYRHTLELLKTLKTDSHLDFQPALSVDFLTKNRELHRLNCPKKGGLPGLLKTFLNARFLSFKDKIQMLLFLPLYLNKMNRPDLTVQEWLDLARQPEQARRFFWDPLCLAALNDSPSKASARLLYRVIEEAFLKTGGLDGLIFPNAELNKLTGKAAELYIQASEGKVFTSSSVKKLIFSDNRIQEVQTIKGEIFKPAAVISALPPKALLKVTQYTPVESQFSELNWVRSAPILSIHLWSRKNITSQTFISLIDSPLQWIFNRQSFLGVESSPPYIYNLIISGAHEWMDKSNFEIENMVHREMSAFFPEYDSKQIIKLKIIKEPDATLSPAPDMLSYRFNQATKVKNFFLAGDWTKTNLPGTVESAVLSGVLAAEKCQSYLDKETTHERIKHRI